MKIASSLPVALLGTLLSTSAFAVQELGTITVSASRLDPETAGTPLYVIDREQIEKSTARNLSQLLVSVPGISVRQLFGTTGLEGTVDLRGFGAAAGSNTLILVDGRRLNDVDLSATNIGGVPLANIERIEIQPGGGSVLYGDGASGGSINIITRQASKSGAEINVATGSFNSLEAAVSGQLVSDAVSLGVFGQRQESDGYRDNSEVRRDNAGVDLRLKLNTQEFFVQGQGSKLESGLPGNRIVDPSIGRNDLHNNPRGTSTPNNYGNEDRYQLITGWKAALSDKLSLIIDGSKRNKEQQSFFDYGGGAGAYTDTTLDTVSLTPRLLFNYAAGTVSNSLQVGVDWYKTDYRSLRGQQANTAPIHIIDIDSETTSPYAFQTSKWNKTTVSLGARQSKVEQSGQDTYDPNAPGAFGPFDAAAAPGEQNHKEEMYEAGISQELVTGLTAMISASRSVRLGTVDEVYESDPTNNYLPVFSPLVPQVGHNLEGSLVYEQVRNRITATVYQQKLENEIHYDPSSGTNNNLGPTLRRGATLAGMATLIDSVTLNASVTHQQALFRDGPNAGNTIPLVANHLAYVGFNWQVNTLFDVALSDSYTGGKYFDNDQANSYGHKIPGYHRVDARLGFAWQYLNAGFAVYNLADGDDHFDEGILSASTPGRYAAYPLPGREYRFNVGLKF